MSGAFGSSQWMYSSGAAGGGSFYSYSIDQSLRFDGSSAYLSKNDFGTATDTNIRTFSTWIKQSDLSFSTYDAIISCAASGIQTLSYYNDNTIGFYNTQGGTAYEDNTTAKFRDVGAWFHIFFTYSHTANEMKLYINGSLTKGFSEGTHGALEKLAETGHITTLMKRSNAGQYVGGYLAETVLLDGYVGDINDFAEEINGIWVPKDISAAGLTYGNNGFYLNYADSSDLGKDVSGQGNHFTANNLAASDVMSGESPTNNFATYNPLVYSTATYAEGNLKFDAGGWSSTYWGSKSSFAIPKDKKIYIELEETAIGGAYYAVGIGTASSIPTSSNIGGTGSITLYHTEFKINGTSTPHSQGSSSAGDIIGIAVDGSTGEVWFSRNGTWFTTGGAGADPSTGTDPIGTVTNPNDEDLFLVVTGNASSNNLFVNFGQDSTNVASAESDANGIGTFEYAVPTDHVCLCASSLSEPTISPNSAEQADDYFDTVLWTGNGTNPADAQEINGLSFQPDFVWVKGRSGTQWHEWHDSVRGVGNRLFSNETNAETDVQSMTSFDNDGFTVAIGTAGNNGTNENGSTYVGWSWKAGGTAVSNTEGSITSQVSAATDAGFSIVSYTGVNTASGQTSTIGHGLASAPELVICKRRNATQSWSVGSTAIGNFTTSSVFNLDNSLSPGATYAYEWGANPTDTVFTTGYSDRTNISGGTFIAYCFHSVRGYCKVGSYVGNGSADGTFVALDFAPAWIMVREITNSGFWMIQDNKIYPFNDGDTRSLAANDSGNETTISNRGNEMDILSNGFKMRASTGDFNASGKTHIYLAFAEAPFKYANAR